MSRKSTPKTPRILQIHKDRNYDCVYVIGALFDNDFPKFFPIFSVMLFSFNYAVTAIAVRYCFRRLIPKGSTWIVVAVLLAMGAIASVFFQAFFIGSIDWFAHHAKGGVSRPGWMNLWFFVPNPFWIMQPRGMEVEIAIQIGFALFWFLALLPFVYLWARRRFAAFVRYEPEKQI